MNHRGGKPLSIRGSSTLAGGGTVEVPKLIYVMNRVDPDDSQHFVPVMRTLSELRSRGWQVVVLSEKGGTGKLLLEGCEVRFLSRRSRLLRIAKLWTELFWLRTKGYKIVFVRISKYSALASVFAKVITRQRVLYWQSGTIFDFDSTTKPFRHQIDLLLLKLIARRSTFFVTGPASMMSYYQSQLRLSESKFRILHNDVDLSYFRRSTLKPQKDRLNFLMVHRLSPVRETTRYFPFILDAIKDLSRLGIQAKLTVVGGGPEEESLQALTANYSMNDLVKFIGPIPHRATREYYQEADIFLLPSYREGFPRVLVEAMACGLAVVTTDAGGIKDVLGQRQLAFMSDRDDGAAFAENLIRIAIDEEEQKLLASENLSRAQKFSTSNVAEEFEVLLFQALNLK